MADFPNPFDVETPPGCEGWEEMYPYWALFDERRRESDENRLWFWNSLHFPFPMPPFDMVEVDHPYITLGGWQNRSFAVPPTMGVDYRIVNGYVYISPNPVTDPAKIAERAGYFEKRAGHYFQNWEELYAGWRTKMKELNREVESIEVPDLPEYEPDEVVFGDRNLSNVDLLRAFSHTLRCAEMMWQHHFEFLLLGYGAYHTFAEFIRGALPDIPDQHISQMVAGIDVVLFRPDAELRRLARAAIDAGVDSAFAEGRSPDEIDVELRRSEEGRRWLDQLEEVKDPARERDRLAEEYGSLLNADARPAFEELLGLARTVFPLVEEHKFYCDYWFQTRFFNKVREFGALLARHGFLEDGEDIFNLSRHEAMEALEELSLTWSTGGPALGPQQWPPIVARRRELLERLSEWTPPPAIGRMPEEVSDPIVVMLWGVTPQRLREWARSADGNELSGAPASPGEVEGPARVVRGLGDLDTIRPGEILVCTVTSPAWAPIFSKIAATVTDIGGIMSHAAIVSPEDGLPAAVGTGTATSRISTGQLLRVDGTTGVVTIMDGD